MATERTWREVRDLIRADAVRYVYYATGDDRISPRLFLHALAANPGLQASAIQRVMRHLRTRPDPGPVHRIVTKLAQVVRELHKIVYGISLSMSAEFGPGLYVAHHGGIWVGVERTGPNCNIGHDVTLGHNGGSNPGRPTLGARVQVGPGAKVLGRIELGDDAVVGANSVVTRSVPPRGVAVGVPAVVRSTRGSFELIRYPGWEEDPERRESQEMARRESAARTETAAT